MSIFGSLFSKPRSNFDELCEKARANLATQTAAHQGTWGLGTSERWNLDQETGQLAFTFSDRIAVCPAQIIGTWNSKAETWLWAWSNKSILAPLASVSHKMRQYGEQHRIGRLTTAKWSASGDEAWLMAALASLLFQQQGAYRGPAGETHVFMTFGEITIRKR
jgi:hypothetical protein